MRGYEAAVAFSQPIEVAGEEAAFDDALAAMLAAYDDCVRLGADTPLDEQRDRVGGATAEATRARFLSRRIEAAIRPTAKACEACGLAPARDYDAPLRLDAHHAAPEGWPPPPGEPRWRRADLHALCPTCHRAIHTLPEGATVADLRARIRFAPARIPP